MSTSNNPVELMHSVIKPICPLEEAVLEEFTGLFGLYVMHKHDCFLKQGDMAHRIGFVAEGLLRSYYITRDGNERNKHFFVAGSFVAPLTSLVLKVPSPLYIDCQEDSLLLVTEYERLLALYEKYPVLNKLGRILVEFAWIGKERRETQLIMYSARERYEAFLEEYPGLEDRIPQYQVASYLGITPVQLSRIRKQGKHS